MEVSRYLKLHYRAIVTKTGAGVETKTDKTENLEITDKAMPLNSRQRSKNWGKKKAYSTKDAGKTRDPPKKKSGSYFSSCTKISSHRIEDLNLKPETQSSRQKYRK